MSTRRKLVELDVDIDEAPVGEDVRRWPDTAGSGCHSSDISVTHLSPSSRRNPRYLHRSSSVGQCRRTTGLSRSPIRTDLGGLVDDKLAPNVGQWWETEEQDRNKRSTAPQVVCGLLERPRRARNKLAPNMRPWWMRRKPERSTATTRNIFCGLMERPWWLMEEWN